MGFIHKYIYPRSPVFIQNFMISGFGLLWYQRRYGKNFKKYLSETKKREFSSAEEWGNYQQIKLRDLLVHAYENVPFYNNKFKAAGFNSIDFRNFELKNLHELPYLEKDELRQFGISTLVVSNKHKGTFISSSGSTGTPTKIYLPEYFHQHWYAIGEARMRNWAGVDYKTPRGMIGGRRILPTAELKPPFYRYNIVEKQTYFSAYHISAQTAPNYLEGIIKNGVEYMTGYAMSNFLLAKYFEDLGLKIPKMRAVITSSEKLTPEMRETLSRVYQCKVFDAYSGCEACGLISESPEGKLLFSPDSGILELIKEDGTYTKPGEIGEIVLTGLHNFDQPLIRYRIGDYARFSTDQSPVGGRNMPVIDEIIGRVEDVVYGADGRSMVRFHGIFIDIEGLKSAQIVQHSYESFTLRLVVDENCYNQIIAEETLTKRMKSQLGEISITFDYKTPLVITKNGKFKAVISEINN